MPFIVIKLLFDFINITGEVNQWTELPFKSIQIIVETFIRFLAMQHRMGYYGFP